MPVAYLHLQMHLAGNFLVSKIILIVYVETAEFPTTLTSMKTKRRGEREKG